MCLQSYSELVNTDTGIFETMPKKQAIPAFEVATLKARRMGLREIQERVFGVKINLPTEPIIDIVSDSLPGILDAISTTMFMKFQAVALSQLPELSHTTRVRRHIKVLALSVLSVLKAARLPDTDISSEVSRGRIRVSVPDDTNDALHYLSENLGSAACRVKSQKDVFDWAIVFLEYLGAMYPEPGNLAEAIDSTGVLATPWPTGQGTHTTFCLAKGLSK